MSGIPPGIVAIRRGLCGLADRLRGRQQHCAKMHGKRNENRRKFKHAKGIALIAGAFLAAPALAATPWSDDFTDPTLAKWCFAPACERYSGFVGQLGAYQVGGGEQMYWDKTVLGKPDGYDVMGAGGGRLTFYVSRLIGKDAPKVLNTMAAQKVTGTAQASIASAKWKAPWLESRQPFLPGQTLQVMFLPGYDQSYWGGPWAFDHTSGSFYFEIDLAETTFNSDGTMHVRQVIHAGSPSNTVGCTWDLQRQWIYPSFAWSVDGRTGTFNLNGKTCTVQLPPEAAKAQPHVLLTQQVGGLAKPSTATTGNMSSLYGWVHVTTP